MADKEFEDEHEAGDLVSIGIDPDSKMVVLPGKKCWMGMTPVTQRLYKKVMGVNPSYHQLSNEELSDEERSALEKIGDTSNNPVENVNWHDAVYFCNKLSIMEGLTPVYLVDGESDPENWWYKPHSEDGHGCFDGVVECDWSANGYCLPMNVDWEDAACEDDELTYSGSDDLDEVGWFKENSDDVTHPVAQKKPNANGLYDMSGNVWEWMWDPDPDDNELRDVRGGCYEDKEELCELDTQISKEQVMPLEYLGFRLMRNFDTFDDEDDEYDEDDEEL